MGSGKTQAWGPKSSMKTWWHGLPFLTQGIHTPSHLCIWDLIMTSHHPVPWGSPCGLEAIMERLASFPRSLWAQSLKLCIPVLLCVTNTTGFVSPSYTPVWNTEEVRHCWPLTLLSFMCMKSQSLFKHCVLYLLLVFFLDYVYLFVFQ